MKLYRYESSKNTGHWTESKGQANKEYEEEKDYLMADEP
ncbi:DNA-directed RNA polymerase subunit delta, partial [Enterococcus faecalis]|nr:DNA-directed RNA polymerase subunit delta [Enterococcus faecalis]